MSRRLRFALLPLAAALAAPVPAAPSAPPGAAPVVLVEEGGAPRARIRAVVPAGDLADLVVLDTGAAAGWVTGQTADVERSGLPIGRLLVTGVRRGCAVALIEDVGDLPLAPGDVVRARLAGT